MTTPKATTETRWVVWTHMGCVLAGVFGTRDAAERRARRALAERDYNGSVEIHQHIDTIIIWSVEA